MFTVCSIVGAALAALAVGYSWARVDLADARHQLEQQRAALESEWKALDRTRQVREIYLAASRDMDAVVRQTPRYRTRGR